MFAKNASRNERVHVLVIGRVQGVYYRSSANEQARALGVTGWVRNLPTGEVELCAEGPHEVLEQLVAWCRMGPPAAQVEQLKVRYEEATGEFADFLVRREPISGLFAQTPGGDGSDGSSGSQS